MGENRIIMSKFAGGTMALVGVVFGAIGGLLGFIAWIFLGGWLDLIQKYGLFEFLAEYGGMEKRYFPYVAVFAILGIVLGISYKGQLVVTDKRIYGSARFGRRVDLPLDSISSVGTGWLNSISVATSSGSIRFYMIENRNAIHSIISKLLIDRQEKSSKNDSFEGKSTAADELKKYKELLDGGVITQEEFDAKKKQLLGL